MTHKRRQVTTIHLPKEVNLSGIPRITRKKDEKAEKFQAVQEKSSAHVQKRAGTFLPFFVQKLFCFVQKIKKDEDVFITPCRASFPISAVPLLLP
jgi:hypothetical protein